MRFKVGDVVKYKEYNSKTMIYHKNFVIDQILLDASGNIILVRSIDFLLKDINIDYFDRKVIGVENIELDLDYLRTDKINKIKNV